MLTPPLFFRQHELAADADEQLVTEAYEKSLGKIDPQEDRFAFESLRMAYEEALAWIRYRDSTGVIDPALIADATAKQNTMPNFTGLDAEETRRADQQATQLRELLSASPQELARAVFNEMLAGLRAQPDEFGKAAFFLQQALDDLRVASPAASTAFACLLADYLQQGWHAGDGDLVEAAIVICPWARERSSLTGLAVSTRVLECSIPELHHFRQQDTESQAIYRHIIRLTWQREFPRELCNVGLLQAMSRLQYSYPTCLALMTSMDQFNRYHGQAIAVLQSASPKSNAQGEKFRASLLWKIFGNQITLWIIFATLLVCAGLWWDKVNREQRADKEMSAFTPQANFDSGMALLKSARDAGQTTEKAIPYLQHAARAGHIPAALSLSHLYLEGAVIAKDEDAALLWMTKAAELGDTDAQVQVAEMYLNGIGQIVHNSMRTDAFAWYQKAAVNGNALAQFKLASMFAEGVGTKRDQVKALEWITLAAEKGQVLAQRNLGLVYLHGSWGQEKNEDKAIYWLSKSALQNNVDAQRTLGQLYENKSDGNVETKLAAADWYAMAARRDDRSSRLALTKICMDQDFIVCQLVK